MKLLTPVDPGVFSIVEPSSHEVINAWGTSFQIGNHFYSMRVETVSPNDLGLDGFYKEQRVDSLVSSVCFVVKFDNAVNEIETGHNYKRLPDGDRLKIGEMLRLQQFLAGGIQRFLSDHNPPFLIGIPNDVKLANWYAQLARRSLLVGHCAEMRSTAFHKHKVLLVCRRG
ncbi:hypothetical protein [Azospirillum sp.]|uniref:hypothetical protein n=1 Tax=Azospirillum sp. TaxID=34012 RepID=UPI00260CD6DB|nr:hypothetical protein [Azospirillum sp.]